MGPLRRALVASLLLAACARARASDTDLPEGVAPGSGAPRTDREVSRAPADRSVAEPGLDAPLIRDHVGIPVPAGSATSRALREGSARDGGDEGDEGEEGFEGDEGDAEEPASDEGDEAGGEGEAS